MIITSNDPSAGYVSWSGVTIKYKGVTYTITDDNSNEPFIWWDFTTPTVFLGSATMPTLTDNDFVAIYNDSGTYQLAGIRSRQVHGGMIMTGTIPAAALEETYVETTGNETVAGIKTFSFSPIVPTPTTDYQASTKKYADEAAPAVHAPSHTDGSDDIQSATAAQKGVATATQITKLDAIAALADVTADNAPKAHAPSHNAGGGDALALTISSTNTLTNKRITKRVNTIASSATPTPAGDTTDIFTVTALAEAATFAAPTGTPTNGQALLLRIKDNATAQTLAYNAIYREGDDIKLPTMTIAGKTMYVALIYNSTDVKYDLVGVVMGI